MNAIHALFSAFLAASGALQAAEISGLVTRVLDGDTIEVKSSPSLVERVRLQNIDAPEKKQAFGNWSKQYLTDMVGGQRVTITYVNRDRYGRILGKVSSKDIADVNKAMVANGAAWVYEQYNTDPNLPGIERAAKNQRLGLWADNAPVPPWIWRQK
ncbi:thermonuclease family protein [Aeromonas hydrophila]|uniref:thermonuclease family protein n=1 Tax=Aeromonas hydrophila TaxID=644 RepID=UPI002258FE42|nr:thermonuclease family protein [Aeromonas hydrophila]MCX4117204.1 thermonuclease family protein [Aeromonas hydrophila]